MEKDKKDHFKYIVTGMLAGTANGLFGSGGGLFLVPLFTHWIHMEQKKAFASSVAVILPFSIVSAATYFFRGNLELKAALPFIIGGTVGGLLSGRLFKRLPAVLLRKVFGLLIIYGGIRAIFNI